jgi:hypothetical protein
VGSGRHRPGAPAGALPTPLGGPPTVARHTVVLVAEVRVGLSGWRYRQWRGRFYPQGLAQRRELEYVASHFDTV